MESESPESGMEELMRLSQQFTRQEQEHTQREQQKAAQREKTQGVLEGLIKLKVSTAVEQLKLVATPEIIEEINSLKGKSATEDLRKLISSLADDLENHISVISISNPDMAPLEHSMKRLSILMDLFFSLQ
ncbi:hypothetical protein ACFLUO_09345 [Chloroflexota bacterium]